MKPLSQKEHREFKELYESIYTPKEELTEEILDEVFNELVDELIEEGYEEEEAIDIIESATDEYIEEAKVTFGHDTNTRNFYGAPVGAKRRLARQKAGEALKGAKKAVKGAVDTAKSKAAGAATAAVVAGSLAKKTAQEAPGKARAAASDAKKKAKSGIKGFIKRQAQKVVNRMSEELEALEASRLFTEQELGAIMEADSLAAMQARREKRLAAQRKREGTTVTGRDFGHHYHLTPAQQKARRDAEFEAGLEKGRTKKEEVEQVDEDSRRMSNKQHTKRVRSNIKSFGSDYTPPSNYDPDANRGQGEVLTRKQIEKKRRKALRQEEVEQIDEISQKTATKAYAKSATGEFEGLDSQKDVRRTNNLRKHIERKFGKKAAQHADRAAHSMTFGRNSKFMKMPKKPTNEEVEAVGEGLTGERYKEALKKGKQYSRRVSEDPAKRATRGGRGGESDFGAGDRGTGNKSRRRRGLPVSDED